MKKLIVFEIIALVTGFACLLVWTFYMITHYDNCLIATEPILAIRIPEIILGLFSIPILIKMIWNKVKNLK